ncbi:MAG: EpsI family protein [Nitrospirota bacterium]|jgi:EpsI family protein
MRKPGKYLIILVLFLASSVVVFMDGRLSERAVTVNIEDLPLSIGAWKGRDFEVDKRTRDILETDYILNRTYTNPHGDRLTLLVVYYPDNKLGFHRPEACNVGAGSQIEQRGVHAVNVRTGDSGADTLDVNELVMGGSSGDKIIFYFFVSGKYMTNNYLQFRLHMMKQQLGFRIPSGAQVQIHGSIRGGVDHTVSVMEDFVRSLKPLLADFAV